MKLSIIIPTFNEEEYLPKLLESIKKQDFTDYEVIVADAKSNDNTKEIAKSYGCKIVDGGLPGIGRNKGAEVAEGELLLFLDSDLELTDNYLKNVIDEFESKNLGIAITKMTPLSEKKRDKFLHDLANWFMIAVENIKPHGAGCYGIISQKKLHDKCKGFNEDLTFGEDTDYIERLAEISRFKVLRNAKIGVSTRRLEEEGLYTLLKQYGKSTINDFRGIRTEAEELGYGFGHDPIEALNSEDLEKIEEESKNHKYQEKEENESLVDDENIKINDKDEEIKTIAENINTSKTSDNIHSPQEINLDINKAERKRIFYSICGEGMGHAIRSSVILKYLCEKYDVYIFSSDRAYKFLSEKFDNVYEIGGFNTVYENNKVRTKKTLFKALKTNPTNLKEGYQILYKQCRIIKPNIIISDFENYSSILSKIMNIPLISLDNIHMITQGDYDYPPNHKADMLTAKAVTKSYILRPKKYLITSFFFPPLKHPEKTEIYPPILREDILKLKEENEDHILVYQTSSSSRNLIEGLKEIDEQFVVYGFNEDKIDENLTFRLFNEDRIYEDMRTAKAIITNGGFTMITEAIYLKKPICSIPAHKNFEQILNGFYVKKLGFGEMYDELNITNLKQFLDNLPKYRENLKKVKKWNNNKILKDLEKYIEKYSKNY